MKFTYTPRDRHLERLLDRLQTRILGEPTMRRDPRQIWRPIEQRPAGGIRLAHGIKSGHKNARACVWRKLWRARGRR